MLCPIAAICLMAAGTMVDQPSPFKTVDLRCENLSAPSCVDSEAPRLSWKTEASTPNWRQSAYRVIVSSTEKGTGDLWDSGKVESAESNGIVYGGKPLRANGEYFWKVQTWDADGRASDWSKAGKWEMGLLSAG